MDGRRSPASVNTIVTQPAMMKTDPGPCASARKAAPTGARGARSVPPNQSTLVTRPRSRRGTWTWSAVTHRTPKHAKLSPLITLATSAPAVVGTSPYTRRPAPPSVPKRYIARPFRRTWIWAIAVAPTASPRPTAALMRPYVSGPPPRTLVTRSGSPTVIDPTKAAAMSDQPKIVTQSHSTEKTNAKPSRISVRIEARDPAVDARARVIATAAAERKNVTALNANAADGPAVATRRPPTTGPPTRAPWRERPCTALPGTRISSGTSSGMIAPSAGMLNADAAPNHTYET